MQYDDKKSCVHCVSMHALGKEDTKPDCSIRNSIYMYICTKCTIFFSLFCNTLTLGVLTILN